MSKIVKNVFNPDFSFDLGDSVSSKNDAETTLKKKLKRENYLKNKNSDDDDESESDSESNQEIISKEDTVRIKSQSAKKISQNKSDFFEELNQEDLHSDMVSF